MNCALPDLESNCNACFHEMPGCNLHLARNESHQIFPNDHMHVQVDCILSKEHYKVSLFCRSFMVSLFDARFTNNV